MIKVVIYGVALGMVVLVVMAVVVMVVMAVVALVNVVTHDTREINGEEYKVYGLLNEDDIKDSCIEYNPDWSNIVVGSIFFETVIAPIYIFGFSAFEPVGVKQTEECLAEKAQSPEATNRLIEPITSQQNFL